MYRVSVYKLATFEVCRHLPEGEVESDFSGGPEGTEHRHPHEVFHGDCRLNALPECHHH